MFVMVSPWPSPIFFKAVRCPVVDEPTDNRSENEGFRRAELRFASSLEFGGFSSSSNDGQRVSQGSEGGGPVE